LYAQWRFRGIDPWVAYNGRVPRSGEVVWPSRLEAVLTAFAIEAAQRERDSGDILQAISAFGGGD
jgi:hypothetical protein